MRDFRLRLYTLSLPAGTSLLLLAGIVMPMLTACVTARYEPYKDTDTVIGEGQQVVLLSRRHHATHEAEPEFIECVGNRLASGSTGLDVYPTPGFEDGLYPWFEPSLAPLSPEELTELLERPGVLERVRETNVRYIVWLDGSTDRLSSGGGITCGAGVGGAGCVGLAWWEDGARYDATIWDLEEMTSAGTIHVDVRGRSTIPAIVLPIPIVTRPEMRACRGLTQQLKLFLTTPSGYGAGPDPDLG